MHHGRSLENIKCVCWYNAWRGVSKELFLHSLSRAKKLSALKLGPKIMASGSVAPTVRRCAVLDLQSNTFKFPHVTVGCYAVLKSFLLIVMSDNVSSSFLISSSVSYSLTGKSSSGSCSAFSGRNSDRDFPMNSLITSRSAVGSVIPLMGPSLQLHSLILQLDCSQAQELLVSCLVVSRESWPHHRKLFKEYRALRESRTLKRMPTTTRRYWSNMPECIISVLEYINLAEVADARI
jgi:hypothetical protein